MEFPAVEGLVHHTDEDSWHGDTYYHQDDKLPGRSPWEHQHPAPPEPKTLVELLTDGGSFIFDQPEHIPAIWGRGSNVLWAEGESLMIAGSPGVGKTTLAAQVLRGLLAGGEVLGFPVQQREHVLYLASDRPRQIARALGRNLRSLPRETVADRLTVWKGPPQGNISANPDALLDLIRAANEAKPGTPVDVIVIDSMKDVAQALTEDSGASGYNLARQLVIQAGVDVLELHHTRKAGANGDAPKALTDVYGGMALTAGAGSVILLHGVGGNDVVQFLHLKQPAETVGPFKVKHDHALGVSTIYGGRSITSVIREADGARLTALAVAQGVYGSDELTTAEKRKVTRELEALGDEGTVRQEKTRGVATLYYLPDPPSSLQGPPADLPKAVLTSRGPFSGDLPGASRDLPRITKPQVTDLPRTSRDLPDENGPNLPFTPLSSKGCDGVVVEPPAGLKPSCVDCGETLSEQRTGYGLADCAACEKAARADR